MQANSFDSVEAERSPFDAQVSQFGPGLSASYRLLISVEGGLHRGAAFVAPSSESVLLGQSPACDLVLMDAGVHEQSVRLYEKNGRLVADVMAADVRSNDRLLPVGSNVFDTPRIQLQVGQAVIKIELLRRSRRVAGAVAAQRSAGAPKARRRWAAVTFTGLSMAAALALVGGAVNASSNRNSQRAAHTLDSVIEPFNARGAQIALVSDGNAEPVLRGFIANSQMKDELDRSIQAAGLTAGLQLRDVQQMSESLTRLARLTGAECEARHLGSGRFECQAGTLDTAATARLQALVDQVPGVVSLDVHARQAEPQPAPVVVLAPEPAPEPEPPKVEPPKVVRPPLPVIRHVAVGQHESFAYDATGRRLRVGDIVNGAKVVRVRFEAVELVLDGQHYNVTVTPMLSAAAGTATN